ncbi:Uncharacterised protein [Klebsiella aerogenes]|nr:Uncharacterised protein [Klebsiella aerogenes]
MKSALISPLLAGLLLLTAARSLPHRPEVAVVEQ